MFEFPPLMTYRIRQRIANSLVVLPLAGMVFALLLARVLYRIDYAMGWLQPAGTGTVAVMLSTMAASMFSLIVFISTALLVAIQLASAQLTPRVIGLLFRDPIMKIALSWFSFTFILALSVIILVQDNVPLLSVRVAAYSCVASLIIFFILFDHVGSGLRPSGILKAIVGRGRHVIEETYPFMIGQAAPDEVKRWTLVENSPVRIVTSSRSGVVLTYDKTRLVLLASRAECVLELVPRVGDLVSAGGPLIKVYGGKENLSDHDLRQLVVLGLERTLERDPVFVFRIIVDIAAKALSPAINDPTTAVLALDQIQHLLQNIGSRILDDGYIVDMNGEVRLIVETPDWDDYVRVALTEIRHLGGASVQVTRRLQGLLLSLIQNLPEERTRLLQEELRLLRNSAHKIFGEEAERALALRKERTLGRSTKQ